MTPIPMKLREEMSHDPFMEKCCLADHNCIGRIEWHHALIFAHRQVQERFCILPACSGYHHRYAERRDIKTAFKCVWLNRATNEELQRYSKAIDYIDLKKRLCTQ